MSTPFDRDKISKVGDWKTINQRELKARGARKKQRRGLAVASTGAALAGAAYARSPKAVRSAAQSFDTARRIRPVVGTREAGRGLTSSLSRNPTGAVAAGGASLVAGGLGVAGTQRGVEGYHQHKINQRRRANAQQRVAKKDWSDKRLAGHKRAQSYISSAGATLGIGALGAVGASAALKRPQVAAKLSGRLRTPVNDLRDKASRASSGLTTGSAGVGGIGGYNFAAIQSQEAKKAKRDSQRVRKNMGVSVWGIDHGESISKSDDARRHVRSNAVLAGTLGYPGSAIHAGVKGKKGRKLGAATVAGGSTLVGGVTGAAIGQRAGGLGRIAGSAVGGAAGGYLGSVNNVKRGRIKGVSAEEHPMGRARRQS